MIKKTEIRLCMGSSCFSRGNFQLLPIIEEYIDKHDLSAYIDFRGHLCQGKCNEGPNLIIGKKEYHKVNESIIERILNEEFAGILKESGSSN